MRLHLTWQPDYALLTVLDGGELTEVRGHKLVGSAYIGDRLDRVIAAMPRTVNLSELFADVVIHVRDEDARAIRAALRREDQLVAAIKKSTLRGKNVFRTSTYHFPVRSGKRR
jgi:hypothetical protein